jgi:hypothetical protein
VNINEVSTENSNSQDDFIDEDNSNIYDDSESIKLSIKTALSATKNAPRIKYISDHKDRIYRKAIEVFTHKPKVQIKNMTVLYNLSKQNVPNQYIAKVKNFLAVMLFKKTKTYNHVIYSIYWMLNPDNRKNSGDSAEIYFERCYLATYKRLFSWYADKPDFVHWLLELDFKYITSNDDLFCRIGFNALNTFYMEMKKELQSSRNNEDLKLLNEFHSKAKSYYEHHNENLVSEQEVEI